MLSVRIKELRESLFLSQEAFAKELKVSVATINRWETGKVRPNISAMKGIKGFCDCYSVSFSEIEKEWHKSASEGSL